MSTDTPAQLYPLGVDPRRTIWSVVDDAHSAVLFSVFSRHFVIDPTLTLFHLLLLQPLSWIVLPSDSTVIDQAWARLWTLLAAKLMLLLLLMGAFWSSSWSKFSYCCRNTSILPKLTVGSIRKLTTLLRMVL